MSRSRLILVLKEREKQSTTYHPLQQPCCTWCALLLLLLCKVACRPVYSLFCNVPAEGLWTRLQV
jgi:hypothetical protein